MAVAEGKEPLVPFTVRLEEDQLRALEEVARELARAQGQRWSRGAVVRLAVSAFLSQRGRMA